MSPSVAKTSTILYKASHLLLSNQSLQFLNPLLHVLQVRVCQCSSYLTMSVKVRLITEYLLSIRVLVQAIHLRVRVHVCVCVCVCVVKAMNTIDLVG